MDVVGKQIAELGEPVPYGDVPLAPFGLSHRTEAELAAALADPPEHEAPSLAPTGIEPSRSMLASLAALVRR
jgi:hypothetical protein